MDLLVDVLQATENRGQDSFGFYWTNIDRTKTQVTRSLTPPWQRTSDFATMLPYDEPFLFIAHARAEPTTERVDKKRIQDIQPFEYGGWMVGHNGTIANDKALCQQHGWHPDTNIDSVVLPYLFSELGDVGGFDQITGSYALLAIGPGRGVLQFAVNYRPLYYVRHLPSGSIFIVSDPTPFVGHGVGRMGEWQVEAIPAYHKGFVQPGLSPPVSLTPIGTFKGQQSNEALVVCSGGLDSVVVAAEMAKDGHDVTLLHYEYGCRATAREKRAIRDICARMGWKSIVVPLGDLFTTIIGASPLVGAGTVNLEGDGEAGAEFAHEWVPARNLVMLSIAVAIAEAKGIPKLALGINIEEAGAYPDNEAEFVRRLNRVLPFAVKADRSVEILMPVANKVKHEIVLMGLMNGAPLDLTWSCYEGGDKHCGKCGPCYMRRVAFSMNGVSDPCFEPGSEEE
jgi:7-cyano-7-deazaguanine synthase